MDSFAIRGYSNNMRYILRATVKKIFKWNPLTKRSQGRPKYNGRITSNSIFVK
jgi:hypothetical protein